MPLTIFMTVRTSHVGGSLIHWTRMKAKHKKKNILIVSHITKIVLVHVVDVRNNTIIKNNE